MQSNIHPDYHEITVKMTDGTEFKTRSTYGKKGAVLQLDIDIKTHTAWTGGNAVLKNAGKVAKFNDKYGSLGFNSKGKKAEADESK